jgi:hypothetical protein
VCGSGGPVVVVSPFFRPVGAGKGARSPQTPPRCNRWRSAIKSFFTKRAQVCRRRRKRQRREREDGGYTRRRVGVKKARAMESEIWVP